MLMSMDVGSSGTGNRRVPLVSRPACDDLPVETVLTTATPEGVTVVLPALVYAKILGEHPTVANLEWIERTYGCRRSGTRILGPAESASSAVRKASGYSSSLSSETFLRSS
jgi:hypothetical protein